MKPASLAALICAVLGLAGCTTGTKFIDPRTELDKKIYYIEQDSSKGTHAISGTGDPRSDRRVTRVPMPVAVDVYSTIHIVIAKAELAEDKAGGPLSKESDGLLERKQAAVQALRSLDTVVRARTRTVTAYEQRNLDEFFKARDESDRLEREFRNALRELWPRGSESYSALLEAYDRPRFQKLQEFLGREIAAIEASHRKLELALRTRQRSLAMEAFLTSQGKQPAAIHLDGYDAIKAESLVRRDPLGLDLSPDERKRLEAQIKATEELAATLERVRRGEVELNEALRKLAGEMAPQIGTLLSKAEDLYKHLGPDALKTRAPKTEELFRKFLAAVEKRNKEFFERKKVDLQREKNKLVAELPREALQFQKALQDWKANGAPLKNDWESATPGKATPETMLALINATVDAAKSFEELRKKLPAIAQDIEARVSIVVESYLKELREEEKAALLNSEEAVDLKADLEGYAADFRQAAALVVDVSAVLGRLQHPVADLPGPSSVTLDVPLDKIKDTFINLEQTPRLVGDLVTVRATLKAGEREVDTSLATFRVERFGYYAELSPAVVLVKPRHIAGADTGFRFAPTLSWMHHWAPRPEDPGKSASVFRALDPALGIHSAFTNFSSPTSNSSVQIGLGATLSFWKNRLQFGAGRNLMAKSSDEGRIYYFIGSDLIGLLQAIGIAK